MNPKQTDTVILAELMLDAYRDTIDWRDQTFDDSLAEVSSFFESQPLLENSLMALDENGCKSACLVMYLKKQAAPLIGYIMTADRAKRTGTARCLLQEVLHQLKRDGHSRVLGGITAGNTPSENLFKSFGFQQIS